MHLINEIIEALLARAISLFGVFRLYILALSGGQRATLLTRLGAITGIIGGGTLYFAARAEGALRAVAEPLAYGILALSVLLLIIALPNVKRVCGYAGVVFAIVLSVAHILGHGDVTMLVLAAAVALMSVSALLIDDRYLTGSIRGALAEWRVHQILGQFCKRGGSVIDNAVFPNGESAGASIEVDHILINHAGVFVIETKGMSGVIDGDPQEDYWRQVLRNTENRFFSPIRQNDIHVRAISKLVGDGIPVHSVVVFTSAKFSRTMPPNVLHIRDLRRYLKQFKVPSMDTHLMKIIAARIEAAMDSSRTARDMHIRRVATKRLTEYAD